MKRLHQVLERLMRPLRVVLRDEGVEARLLLQDLASAVVDVHFADSVAPGDEPLTFGQQGVEVPLFSGLRHFESGGAG